MLELLASPPGTGKTTHCIELFREQILKSQGGIDSRSFFVLPSREHAERIQNLILKKNVVGRRPAGAVVAGLFNAHIVTINDLASRLIGMPAIPGPSEALRQSLVREVLESRASWPYFEASKTLPGFHKLLAELIREFSSGLLSIDEFEKRSQPLLKDPVFRSKFRDLSVLLKNYQKRLEALGLAEPEDAIAQLIESRLDADSVDLVVIDGFYHFSRAQKELIRTLTRISKKVVVTLTMPDNDRSATQASAPACRSGRDLRPELFYYPERTRQFLLELGFKQNNVSFASNHRFKNPVIAHLERQLFSKQPERYPGTPTGLTVFEAPGARAEIEMIAREIRRLSREGALYLSDICVLLRSVSPYQKMIEQVFGRFGIPVHIHERHRIKDTALAAYLSRFLTLGLAGWPREDLFYLLKSGYHASELDLKDLLILERAAISANITQGFQAWSLLARQNKVPAKLLACLQSLAEIEKEVFGASGERAFAVAIRGLIGRLCPNEPEAEKAIDEMLRGIERFGAGQKGDKSFSIQSMVGQLQSQLESGLYSIKPGGKNRVQVYDVVMALPKEYKVVFIAGLLEKTFPQNISEEALFKDQERRVINRKGLVLEERGTRAAGERYFFYMALTRAREKLVLSYPLYDGEGRPMLPSFFNDAVLECLEKPPLKVTRHLDEFLPLPREWETEDELIRGLAEWASQPLPGTLKRWTEQTRFRAVKEAAAKPELGAKISDPELLKEFAALRGPFSATRLEKMAACPFHYFASEVLELVEPFEGHEAAWMGTLLHKVLEVYYKELALKDRREGSFLKDRPAMKKTLLALLEPEAKKSALASEPVYRFRAHLAQMKRTLERFVDGEAALFEKRRFVPSAFELTFGLGRDADHPVLEIDTPDGKVGLRGQIDRVDVSPDGRQALVVDYKRSERDAVRKKFEMGLELQLPIYLLAVQKFLKVDTIGAEHRYLTKDTRAGIYREDARKTLLLHANTKTYPVDELRERLKSIPPRIGALVARLKRGDIAVKSRSCQWCDFGPLCRFEKWRLAYREAELEKN